MQDGTVRYKQFAVPDHFGMNPVPALRFSTVPDPEVLMEAKKNLYIVQVRTSPVLVLSFFRYRPKCRICKEAPGDKLRNPNFIVIM